MDVRSLFCFLMVSFYPVMKFVRSDTSFRNETDIHIVEKTFNYKLWYFQRVMQVYWKVSVESQSTPELHLLADDRDVRELSPKYDYNITNSEIFLTITNVSEKDLTTRFSLVANNSIQEETLNLTYSVDDVTLKVEIIGVREKWAAASCAVHHIRPVNVSWNVGTNGVFYDTTPDEKIMRKTYRKIFLYMSFSQPAYSCLVTFNNGTRRKNVTIDVVAVRNGLEIYGMENIITVDEKTQKLIINPKTNLSLTCGSSANNHTSKVQWARHSLDNDINDTTVTTRDALFSTLQTLKLSDNIADTYFCKAWTTNETLEYKIIHVEYSTETYPITGYTESVLIISVLSITILAVIYSIKMRKYRKLKKRFNELYRVGFIKQKLYNI